MHQGLGLLVLISITILTTMLSWGGIGVVVMNCIPAVERWPGMPSTVINFFPLSQLGLVCCTLTTGLMLLAAIRCCLWWHDLLRG